MRDVASRIWWKRKQVDVELSFHVSLARTFVFGGLFLFSFFNGIDIIFYEWFGVFFAWG